MEFDFLTNTLIVFSSVAFIDLPWRDNFVILTFSLLSSSVISLINH